MPSTSLVKDNVLVPMEWIAGSHHPEQLPTALRNALAWYRFIGEQVSGSCELKRTPMAIAVFASMADGRQTKICHLWNQESQRYACRIEFLLGHPQEGLAKAGKHAVEAARGILAQNLPASLLHNLDKSNPQFDATRAFNAQQADRFVTAIHEIARYLLAPQSAPRIQSKRPARLAPGRQKLTETRQLSGNKPKTR